MKEFSGVGGFIQGSAHHLGEQIAPRVGAGVSVVGWGGLIVDGVVVVWFKYIQHGSN